MKVFAWIVGLTCLLTAVSWAQTIQDESPAPASCYAVVIDQDLSLAQSASVRDLWTRMGFSPVEVLAGESGHTVSFGRFSTRLDAESALISIRAGLSTDAVVAEIPVQGEPVDENRGPFPPIFDAPSRGEVEAGPSGDLFSLAACASQAQVLTLRLGASKQRKRRSHPLSSGRGLASRRCSW